MDDTERPHVPPRLTWMGEALAPLLGPLDAVLATHPAPLQELDDLAPSEVEHGLAAHVQLVERLVEQGTRLGQRVADDEAVSRAGVLDAVGDFGSALLDLQQALMLHARLLAMRGRPADALLAALHRHALVQTRAWLALTVATLADPLPVWRSQGGAPLDLTLRYTAAPELMAFHAALARRRLKGPQPVQPVAPQPRSEVRFGWLAMLGWILILKAIFGGDCDHDGGS